MSDQDRTLQPTAKRRQLARAEGHVAASVQVTAAAIWLATSCGLLGLGGAGLTMMKGMLVQFWHGMLFTDWLRLLAKHRYQVHPLRWGLASTITLLTLYNSKAATSTARRHTGCARGG